MFKNIDHPMKFFLRIKSDDSYEELWNERKEELFDEAKIIELIKANEVDFHKNEGPRHYWQPNNNKKQLFNDRYKGGKELFVKWTAGKHDYCTDDFDAFSSLGANIINGHFYQCREYKELCSRFDESLLEKYVFKKIRWKKGEKQPTELWNALVDYSYSRNSEDVLRKYAETATDSMIKALEKRRENEIEGRYIEYTGTFYNRLAKLANSPKVYDVFSEISSCINPIDTMNKTIDDVGGIRSEDKEKIKNYLCNRRLNFRSTSLE